MLKRFKTLYYSLLLFNLLSGSQISDRINNPGIVEAFFDGVISTHMKENKSPSGTISMVYRDRIIFSKGYGYQDIEKNIPVVADKTMFRPGSVSKLFTWTAVMQLKEQGKLDLDTDVNTYLKTFKIKDTYPGEPVTLRHILTHTPGFEDGGVGYLIIEDFDKAIPLRDAMEKYQPKRVNPPGVQTAYSNYATALAGLIVSNISGISFNDYINKNIFEPLNMNHSTFEEPLPEELENNMAIGYAYEKGRFTEKPFEIISSFGPAGAMSASSTDMANFALAFLNGGSFEGNYNIDGRNYSNRILQEATVTEMLTQNFSHDSRFPGMALGFYESSVNGNRLVGHGGDTQYFHSDLAIDLENDLAIFVSFSGAGGAKVRSVIIPAFYNEFFPVVVSPLSISEDFNERANRYAGSYLFWRSNFSTIEKAFLNLGGAVKVAPSSENTIIVTMGDDVRQFIEIDENLFQERGGKAKIAFQENESGKINGMIFDVYPFMSMYKASMWKGQSFNFLFIGLSVIVFLGVMLRLAYQWSIYKSLPKEEKDATTSAIVAAGLNLGFFIFGIIALSVDGDTLFSVGFTPLMKFWLLFPILATIAGGYQIYQAVIVWKNNYWGIWKRIRFSIISLCCLFMIWFYYYWNILGYNYL
ncbi:MAG: serine hydrolase [Candidatus Marinimicrobia bacterium]|jgi:CubicO group peptidase (beta-lactamase class C family)|nr:serine hydrolase [Candidatus Neomarinimicrobiota bacterium]